MAKYYLYVLVSLFILLNVVDYIQKELKQTIKQHTLLEYKIAKQKLYSSHTQEVKNILNEQKKILEQNEKFFFKKDKKETLIFSEIQKYLQSISKSIDGEITKLQSGSVIDFKEYKRYPITLDVRLIPEDLNIFLKNIYSWNKYLYIDSIFIYTLQIENRLRVKITLVGYQLK